ncbi:hypothetical protein D3C76_1471510 [compost metagenome]
MLDVAPFRPATAGQAWFVHVDQAAVLLDVLEFGGADHRVLLGVVDHLEPDDGKHDAQRTHDHEHVFPAPGMHDPAHQRGEEHGGEVLGRVEDG